MWQRLTSSRPVKQGPQVSLKDGALQWVLFGALRVGAQKNVEARKCATMGIAVQQMLGLVPQERVKCVSTVFCSVRCPPYKQTSIRSIPNVVRIRVKDSHA